VLENDSNITSNFRPKLRIVEEWYSSPDLGKNYGDYRALSGLYGNKVFGLPLNESRELSTGLDIRENMVPY
jgi:hypothetical protein